MLFKRLREDIDAFIARDPAARSRIEILICYPGLHAIYIYRFAHLLWGWRWHLSARIVSHFGRLVTGIEIHPGATIGRRFVIDHGLGVVVGETTEIGNHVKLYQGVTLGALSFATDDDGNLVRGHKRHPTIEDGVVIYASATVLGGKTVVGHHSVIGSSVWLTYSVEPHTTVTMEKPKLRIRAEMPDEMKPELNFSI
jgi:serine O-acetyltransferase